MKITSVLTVLLFTAALSACDGGSDSDTQQQATTDQQQQAEIQQQESDIPYNFRMEMQTLMDHYFDLKDAVVESDVQAAHDAATQLSAFTGEVMDEALSSEDQGLWLGIAQILRTETDNLTTAENVEDVRIYFEHISKAMIRVADSFDPIDGPFYLIECEEAQTGDNQWLSRDEEIRNPYQTHASINCGKVEERL